MIVVGLLSGTSMDGLDIAVTELELAGRPTPGDTVTLRVIGSVEQEWPAEVRDRLLAVLPPAATTVEEVCALDTLVGQATARAAASAIDELAGGAADLVVSLGQTVFHWVSGGQALGTLQLGQPAWVVQATGLPVVSDLRARDIAAGGHGAPLASTLDALWLADPSGARRAALNLGGIANVTVVGAPGEPVVALDTGPANCLLDATARRVSGGRLGSDVDGRLAAAGRVDPELLTRLLTEPYYARPAPKSTGRELFHTGYVEQLLGSSPTTDRISDRITDEDVMATLTELTAVTVADACRPFGLVEVVASGGGVRNPTLLAALRRRLGTPLVVSDDRGLPAGAKEAHLVSLLGFLTWHQVPGVLPGATGSGTARVLGRISPGDRPLLLPPPAATPQHLQILR